MQEAKAKLPPLAKEINHRFALADKFVDQAYDHRLAAAIRLKDAEVECNAAKIDFRQWATKFVRQEWTGVRKYLAVGKADDPVLALEDLRRRGKKAVVKHAAKAKKAKAARFANRDAASTAPSTKSKFTHAVDVAEALPDKHAMQVAESIAGSRGFVLVPNVAPAALAFVRCFLPDLPPV